MKFWNTPLVLLTGLLLLGVPTAAGALAYALSTDNGATLGTLTFANGDAVVYDDLTGIATLEFDESNFAGNENLDALHVLANGNLVLSTTNGASLGGVTFSNGDLVEWNPNTLTAALYFDDSNFSSAADIDALSILDNGNMVISTTTSETLGGLTFGNGDLVEYNPNSDTATLYFAGSLFSASEDIDAVHVLGDGTILISTQNAATLGGLTFRDGDVIRYDPVSDTAVLFFSEDDFSGNENVSAVSSPEPTTASLLALGLVGLAAARRRRA